MTDPQQPRAKGNRSGPTSGRQSLEPHPPLVDEGFVEVEFQCDVPADVTWEVLELVAGESLSEPYEVRVVLTTDEVDCEPALMLMARCSFLVKRGQEQTQRFGGIIAELVEGETTSQFLRVHLVVVPAFWLLGQRRDTRIFQDLTVPLVLERVLLADWLETYSFPVRFELDRTTYAECEYRVQYDETDLEFVHRLMQEEGIFYWFDHDEDGEVMVLADESSRHAEIDRPAGASLITTRHRPGAETVEVLRAFHRRSRVRPTRSATRHHDWTRAVPFIATLDGEPPIPGDPPHGAATLPVREEYDHDQRPVTFFGYRSEARAYQGTDYLDQVRLRRESQARDARVGEGRGTVISLRPGRTFELTSHAQPELEASYVVTGVEHRFNVEEESGGRHYMNHFRCLPADVPFRPERRQARPRIDGLQTAVVVGPPGEEIHTDEHGRVKVQFHWDRLGGSDERSSCWVRVAQPWAGAGWGFVFVPRVGMEVTVAFVNGDPDKPMVTGTVYNGENALPHALPHQMTRSTIKTRSVPGGTGYNELSFDDKAGQEQVRLRAQRDYSTVVGRNQRTEVRQDSVVIVRGRQTNLVAHDQTERVSGSVERTVKGDQKETFKAAHLEAVRGKSELWVGEDRSVEVRGAERRDVARTTTLVAGDDVTVETGGNHATLVGTDDEKRSFVLYTHGTNELASSQMTELVSETGIRLRCGDSVVEIMPDEIQLVSPRLVLRAPSARLEVDQDRVYAFGEKKAEIKSNTLVFKGAGAGIKVRTEVQVDGSKILLNSPTNASDPVEEEELTPTTIELCDEDGAPLANQRFILVFDDGSERTGFLDEEGKAELILDRPAKVRFPGLLDATSN